MAALLDTLGGGGGERRKHHGGAAGILQLSKDSPAAGKKDNKTRQRLLIPSRYELRRVSGAPTPLLPAPGVTRQHSSFTSGA